eukprot:10256202-Ditylum_brightwellii.AAC.1
MTLRTFAPVLSEMVNTLQLTMIYSLSSTKLPLTTEKLLDNAYPATKAELTSDIVSAWRAINNGTTPATTKMRKKYWRHWQQHTKR